MSPIQYNLRMIILYICALYDRIVRRLTSGADVNYFSLNVLPQISKTSIQNLQNRNFIFPTPKPSSLTVTRLRENPPAGSCQKVLTPSISVIYALRSQLQVNVYIYIYDRRNVVYDRT